MKQLSKKAVAFILVFGMATGIICSNLAMAATTTPKLSEKRLTLGIGSKFTLKVTGCSKKMKKSMRWKTSNKKIVTVQKGKLKAKKKGKATITVYISNKKLTCKVTVNNDLPVKSSSVSYTLHEYDYNGYDDIDPYQLDVTTRLNQKGTLSANTIWGWGDPDNSQYDRKIISKMAVDYACMKNAKNGLDLKLIYLRKNGELWHYKRKSEFSVKGKRYKRTRVLKGKKVKKIINYYKVMTKNGDVWNIQDPKNPIKIKDQ